MHAVSENGHLRGGFLMFPLLAFKYRTLFRQLVLEVEQLGTEIFAGLPELDFTLR